MERKNVEKRSFYLKKIREFFEREGFLEVETPIMNSCCDLNPNLTPFETEFIAADGKKERMYLHPSPEFQMKKLLGAGFGDIFTICKVFRNGEVGGGRHNPEFTMLEWYRKNADYQQMMNDTENLIRYVSGKKELFYQGKKIDLKKWERKSIRELFQEKCAIDLEKIRDFADLAKVAEKKGYSTHACKTWDDLFYLFFLNEIEPFLGETSPVFVYDYPASQAALSLVKKDNPFFCERFELYIAGQELCNAFSELLDSEKQRERFELEQKEREKLGKTVFKIDEELLTGLKFITEPYGGNALGIDRLMMLLLDEKNIEDVILFPVSKMINL